MEHDSGEIGSLEVRLGENTALEAGNFERGETKRRKLGGTAGKDGMLELPLDDGHAREPAFSKMHALQERTLPLRGGQGDMIEQYVSHVESSQPGVGEPNAGQAGARYRGIFCRHSWEVEIRESEGVVAAIIFDDIVRRCPEFQCGWKSWGPGRL
jgi:hypothetical protein